MTDESQEDGHHTQKLRMNESAKGKFQLLPPCEQQEPRSAQHDGNAPKGQPYHDQDENDPVCSAYLLGHAYKPFAGGVSLHL